MHASVSERNIKIDSSRRINLAAVILKTKRFNVDSAVIISSVNFQFCNALLTLLMMTAESMLSKRPVLRIIVL